MDDQSPVNIIEGDTKVVNLTPLKYGNLNTFDKTEMLLRNTGATGTNEFFIIFVICITIRCVIENF